MDEEVVDSHREDHDDDVVVVSSTAGRRRTRDSAAAIEKKRAALGARGDVGGSAEPDKAIDVEELERLAEKKKATKKGKVKAKRPSSNEPQGSVPKRRKGVIISESSQGKNGDNFIVDDEEASEGNDATRAARRSKGKLKVNDNMNRINTRRIARDIRGCTHKGN
ncbi:hypothetical protein LIER_37331 [Lithospermum erythrorhizon]|uniref:Uncharacterized protein n=1 Tax=Lithospermum erythrorhizon TaxID=34254 RepID=A0AAV3PK74_LITER